jgi:hypothetical protein
MGRTITAAGEYCASVSEEVLRCRLYRHCWDPVYPPWQYDPPTSDVPYWTQPVVCMRCGSGAVDRFDGARRSIGRTYDYCEGYLFTAHEGALARADVRTWMEETHDGRRRRKSPRLRAVS